MPPITETVGTFDGKEGDCFWVEANGTRYQFSLPSPNLVYSANPVSIQDSFGNVLFLSGDPIRVAGRANALLGSDCQPSFILSTAVSEPT
jgi:hypothetical protein